MGFRDHLGQLFPRRTANWRFSIRGDAVVDPDGRVIDAQEAISRLPWVEAVTYPPPHEYVTYQNADPLDWAVLDHLIQKHPSSYMAFFRGYDRPNRYLDLAGYSYWRTSSRSGRAVTHMLNRSLFASSEPPRRVDEGATAIPWLGPPWLPYGSPWPPDYEQGDDGEWRPRRRR